MRCNTRRQALTAPNVKIAAVGCALKNVMRISERRHDRNTERMVKNSWRDFAS